MGTHFPQNVLLCSWPSFLNLLFFLYYTFSFFLILLTITFLIAKSLFLFLPFLVHLLFYGCNIFFTVLKETNKIILNSYFGSWTLLFLPCLHLCTSVLWDFALLLLVFLIYLITLGCLFLFRNEMLGSLQRALGRGQGLQAGRHCWQNQTRQESDWGKYWLYRAVGYGADCSI
jgi:hypothetical protein